MNCRVPDKVDGCERDCCIPSDEGFLELEATKVDIFDVVGFASGPACEVDVAGLGVATLGCVGSMGFGGPPELPDKKVRGRVCEDCSIVVVRPNGV